ncbi:ribose 5-phosphate isomerase B [Elstera litoralis]|nr:ribose 5-phosphate isomerase B [Elstera litoralis]
MDMRTMETRPTPLSTVAFASDHAGVDLKSHLCTLVKDWGYTVVDLGPQAGESVDYPDYADKLAEALKTGAASEGVLICGSGIGISIAANRHPHIRAALVSDSLSARLAREHNNANVIALGARLIGPDLAADAVKLFLTTGFDGGERHARRVAKLG